MKRKRKKKLNSTFFSFKKTALLFLTLFVISLSFLFLFFAKKTLNDTPEPVKIKIARPLERDILKLVRGYPIEKMAPYISVYDRKTAAFIISVAKKESNWGKYAPHLEGRDCFNYWGYRGQGKKITESGYSCFDTPQEAVREIAQRFNELINNSGLDTPQKMIVWKCGWDCSWDDPDATKKWASDVNFYFQKFYK